MSARQDLAESLALQLQEDYAFTSSLVRDYPLNEDAPTYEWED